VEDKEPNMTSIKVSIDLLKRMEKALKESGWKQPMDGCDYMHSDYLDEHVQEAEKRARETLDRVDELIDILGLREEYADETTKIYRPWSPYGNMPYYETTTVRGVHRFLTDVHAAHEASTGAEALARIKSVLGKK